MTQNTTRNILIGIHSLVIKFYVFVIFGFRTIFLSKPHSIKFSKSGKNLPFFELKDPFKMTRIGKMFYFRNLDWVITWPRTINSRWCFYRNVWCILKKIILHLKKILKEIWSTLPLRNDTKYFFLGSDQDKKIKSLQLKYPPPHPPKSYGNFDLSWEIVVYIEGNCSESQTSHKN